MKSMPTKEEVLHFLETTEFTNYQSVPLPHGLKIPGTDLSSRADVVLGDRVRGKTLLDIGTNYGFFPCEALRRGATRAVGIEMDPEYYQVASRAAELNGGTYSILRGQAEDVPTAERFDIVLFLNVLHHVLDPIAALTSLARHCRHTLIVEFCLPDDPQYICELGRTDHANPPMLIAKQWARIRSVLLRLFGHGIPLMAVGNREYHRTFYFSCDAFYNLFVLHHKLFESIEFHRGQPRKRRMLAICRMARSVSEET